MVTALSPAVAREAVEAAVTLVRARRHDAPRWQPAFYQTPPPDDGDWLHWALIGGRGTGKTDAGAHVVNTHALSPPCAPHYPGGHHIAIIAPTLGDALESCVNGPSGLKMHNRGIRVVQGMGGAHVRWPNGAEAKLFGAYTPEDVERFRSGGNRCFVWAEELAAWPKLDAVWPQMRFGLRLGPKPRVVITTTPRARKVLQMILAHPRTVEARTEDGRRPTTDDNPYLHVDVRAALYEQYGGTRLGRQELLGEMLLDVPGALWTRDRMDQNRVEQPPDLTRVVVAVDPSGGHGEGNDEQGIVVAGKGVDARGYVLADRSCKLSPDGWGRRAVQAYIDFAADRIVYEQNFGGEMVEMVIRTAAQAMGVTVATKAVHASRGKSVRAEPIAALYEQGRVSHVGVLPELEDELCTWTPDSGVSPNRLDGTVWTLTELMLHSGTISLLDDDALAVLAGPGYARD